MLLHNNLGLCKDGDRVGSSRIRFQHPLCPPSLLLPAAGAAAPPPFSPPHRRHGAAERLAARVAAQARVLGCHGGAVAAAKVLQLVGIGGLRGVGGCMHVGGCGQGDEAGVENHGMRGIAEQPPPSPTAGSDRHAGKEVAGQRQPAGQGPARQQRRGAKASPTPAGPTHLLQQGAQPRLYGGLVPLGAAGHAAPLARLDLHGRRGCVVGLICISCCVFSALTWSCVCGDIG
jgi:hypothetical protein